MNVLVILALMVDVEKELDITGVSVIPTMEVKHVVQVNILSKFLLPYEQILA